jgi:hypothetical protein
MRVCVYVCVYTPAHSVFQAAAGGLDDESEQADDGDMLETKKEQRDKDEEFGSSDKEKHEKHDKQDRRNKEPSDPISELLAIAAANAVRPHALVA